MNIYFLLFYHYFFDFIADHSTDDHTNKDCRDEQKAQASSVDENEGGKNCSELSSDKFDDDLIPNYMADVPFYQNQMEDPQVVALFDEYYNTF